MGKAGIKPDIPDRDGEAGSSSETLVNARLSASTRADRAEANPIVQEEPPRGLDVATLAAAEPRSWPRLWRGSG